MAELVESSDPQHIHAQLRPIVESSPSLKDHLQQVTEIPATPAYSLPVSSSKFCCFESPAPLVLRGSSFKQHHLSCTD